MPGADAVLVPELSAVDVPQAASNTVQQTIAIALSGLFNEPPSFIRVVRCRRLRIWCRIVPIHHPLLPTRRAMTPTSPRQSEQPFQRALDAVGRYEHGNHKD